MAIKKRGFNLLKNQIEPPTVWSKIYNWVTGTARAIMIVVELVVVLSFGIRIVLDIEHKNLDKDIESKENIIIAFNEAELRFRAIQSKSFAYQYIWDDAVILSDIYAEVNRYIPLNSQEIVVKIDEGKMTISGYAFIDDIRTMETSFKNSSTFVNTELLSVETTGTDSEVSSFTLTTEVRSLNSRLDIIIE